MKKFLNKSIGIFLIAITFFCIVNLTSTAYASNSVGNSAVNRFLSQTGNVDTGVDSPTETVNNFIGSIIYVLQIAFMALAVIMAMALAIKYMASSVNEKAEIKKHLTIYVLGVVLLFAASGLVALLRNFFVEISK